MLVSEIEICVSCIFAIQPTAVVRIRVKRNFHFPSAQLLQNMGVLRSLLPERGQLGIMGNLHVIYKKIVGNILIYDSKFFG